ncbi:MAG: restriction endonuclease subunit S [Clostridia bacterium]|nr:restriction endonuclease subunit S [Clostridia bacterium]
MTTIKLKDCANIKTGKLNSNAAVKDGAYPFFTCDPETSKIDYFSFDEEAILLAGNNASGKFNIKYYVGKFNAYQRTYIINSSTNVLKTKYLYYYLSTKLPQFTTLSSGSATKFLTKAILDNCDVAVPPLAEQSHIVDIRRNIA